MQNRHKAFYIYTTQETIEDLFINHYFPRLNTKFIYKEVEKLRFIYGSDEHVLERLSLVRDNNISLLASIILENHPILNVWSDEKLRHYLFLKAERDLTRYRTWLSAIEFNQNIESSEAIPPELELREKIIILEKLQKKLLRKIYTSKIKEKSIKPKEAPETKPLEITSKEEDYLLQKYN